MSTNKYKELMISFKSDWRILENGEIYVTKKLAYLLAKAYTKELESVNDAGLFVSQYDEQLEGLLVDLAFNVGDVLAARSKIQELSIEMAKELIEAVISEDDITPTDNEITELTLCHPVEMRKNLEGVGVLADSGIDFVAIPAVSDEHKKALIAALKASVDGMAEINAAPLKKACQNCIDAMRDVQDAFARFVQTKIDQNEK